MVFPAGAVNSDTTIDATAVATPPADGIAGAVYQFSPDGIVFAKPVRLTLKYDPAQIPVGTLETQIELAKVIPNGWQPLQTVADSTAKTLSADLNGFSSYGAIPTVHAWLFGSSPTIATSVSAIAADLVGNVYVVGESADYGGPVTQNNRAYITSFTRDGNPRSGWPVRVDLPTGYTFWSLTGVAVDESGNFICATGSGNAVPVGTSAQLAICFTPDGKVRSGWPVFITTTSTYGGKILLDPTANVYVSGSNGARAFVTSYNSSGALRSGWPQTVGGGSLTPAPSISRDTSANIFAVWNSAPFPNSGAVVESFTADGIRRSGFPVLIPDGSAGNYNTGSAIAVDVTGNTAVAWTNFLTGRASITSLDPLGKPRAGWPNILEASNPNPLLALGGVAANYLDNVFVAASFDAYSAANPNNTSDVWLTSYNSSGALRFGFPLRLGSDFDDKPYGVAVNQIGDVFIGGTTNGAFQDVPNPNAGGASVGFVVRVRGE